jgi:hypothetical protein
MAITPKCFRFQGSAALTRADIKSIHYLVISFRLGGAIVSTPTPW